MKNYKSKYIGIKIKGKKIDLHRWVWIQANGPIPEGMVIHHKNEDTHDNRLENLEMMSLEEHTRRHFKGKPFHFTDKWRKEHRKSSVLKSKDKNGLFWCYKGKHLLNKSRFSKRKDRLSGLEDICRDCRSKHKVW